MIYILIISRFVESAVEQQTAFITVCLPAKVAKAFSGDRSASKRTTAVGHAIRTVKSGAMKNENAALVD